MNRRNLIKTLIGSPFVTLLLSKSDAKETTNYKKKDERIQSAIQEMKGLFLSRHYFKNDNFVYFKLNFAHDFDLTLLCEIEKFFEIKGGFSYSIDYSFKGGFGSAELGVTKPLYEKILHYRL